MAIASNRLGNNGGRTYDFLNKPVFIDCQFKVAPADSGGLGITAGSLKGSGVQNVFMHTSATPGSNNGYLNPNPASGFALIQLANNYAKYSEMDFSITPPQSGSNLAINATALTVGQPYVITSVGAGPAGAVTIAPVADVSGSLASTWFRLYDGYGNTFIIWFSVAGVGSAPVGVSGTLVQQSIASGATAATIGGLLATTIAALPSGIAGVFSFTTSGTTTVTVTSTKVAPLPGAPADGAIATGFTFAQTVYATNLACWQGVGLPKGIAPAVGAAFVATATGYTTGGTSSGIVQLPLVSGIDWIEVVGDPNQSLSPVPVGGSPNVGGWILVQFLASTNTTTTTLIPTAPAVGSVINLGFKFEAGSIVIAGM